MIAGKEMNYRQAQMAMYDQRRSIARWSKRTIRRAVGRSCLCTANHKVQPTFLGKGWVEGCCQRTPVTFPFEGDESRLMNEAVSRAR